MTVSSEQSAVSSTRPREKGVTRRVVVFICLLLTVFLRGVSAEAQQAGKVFRIGFLDPSTASGSRVLWEAYERS